MREKKQIDLNPQEIIYLDNNSTTPVDPRVLDCMVPIIRDWYGNAASTHRFGAAVERLVKLARMDVARLLNCSAGEIIFTSGATEGINLAIKGYAFANQSKGNHIITVKTEHKAVLDTCQYLETVGFDLTYLDVGGDGLLDLNELQQNLRSDTILVCVMLANNETGVIQPMADIAAIVRDCGSMLFCDATQAVGKIPVDIDVVDVDILAFSAHKFYGPKGAGGLFIRNLPKRRIKLIPLLHGGGHEAGLRSGTLNVAGIVGLGKACNLAYEEIADDQNRIEKLRDILEKELLCIPSTFVNGSLTKRLYNVTNICFPTYNADDLIGRMPDIAVSNGSACTASLVEPSHVLVAMGLRREDALSSIRFSLGKFNSMKDIALVVDTVKNLVVKNS